jgi:poly(beta-D-mannuronate) lyase
MKTMQQFFSALACMFLFAAAPASAVVREVHNTNEFKALPSTLQAGDVVIVYSNDYNAISKKLTANASTGTPVQIYASPLGSARFTGKTKIELAGTNMIFAGFRFEDGTISSYAMVYSRHSRRITVSNCAFRRFGGDTWVLFQGFDNTMEYCSFDEKTDAGATIVIGPEELGDLTVQRRHRFRFNYMGERVCAAENGWEAMQIGDSANQGYQMACIVENNLFYRAIWTTNGATAGDMEIISNKSCDNVYRNNTLHDNRGQISLRHGDRCLVEGNYIFGDGAAWSTGIRVMGEHHVVRNNYIENTRGYNLRAGICLMPGDANWTETSNGYEACNYAQVYNNTLVNCYQSICLGHTNRDQTVRPQGVQIRDNLVLSQSGDGEVVNVQLWDLNATTFSNNLTYHPDGTYGPLIPGVVRGADLRMTNDSELGYFIPGDGSAAIGAAELIAGCGLDGRGALRPASGRDVGAFEVGASPSTPNRPLVRADVGPSYDGGPTNTFWAPGTAPTEAAATPVASHAAGSYTEVINVALTTPTFGAFIRYTLDGSQPSATNGTIYINPIPLSETTVLRAVAFHSAMANSPELSSTYTISGIAPSIDSQPSSQTIGVGANASFSVVADGTEPLSYQWYINGSTPLSGATNTSLIVSNAQPSDSGDYTVIVSNAYGTATSQTATLSVIAGTILLNDSFDDGVRTNQALPNSAKWYASSSSYPLAVSGGALSVAAGGHALAFFKDSGVQSLAVGEQISASFTLNFSTVGTSAGGLRFGLFNSNGTSRPPDPNNAAFTNYDGYIVTTTAKYPDSSTNSSGSITFRQRNPGVGGTLISTVGSGIYSDVAASPATSQGFVAGINYTVTFTIARTATGTINLSVGVTGGSLTNYTFTADDIAGIVTGFDGFAVLSTSSSGSTYTIDNITVVHGTIPAPAPPSGIFSASPTVGPVPLTVTFTDSSTGAITSVAWDFGDGGTTNFATPTNVQHLYATSGLYTVTLVANGPSAASTNTQSNLITAVDPYTWWASNYFACATCPQAQPDADPYGKGISNTNQFLLGLNPTNPASVFRILSAVRQTTDVVITWAAGGGRTNALQATSGDVNGGYTTNFVDITTPPHIVTPGSGDVTNSYTDVGGATNSPSRYYRVRLVP